MAGGILEATAGVGVRCSFGWDAQEGAMRQESFQADQP